MTTRPSSDGLGLVWQPSLLTAGATPRFDADFAAIRRIRLDAAAWIDLAPAWVEGADALFATLLETTEWSQRERRMYDRNVVEPRLTAGWVAESGAPLEPPILDEMRRALSARYDVDLDSMGLNLYRDGRDSVAWHGDHILQEVEDPVVAIVSLGSPRRFLLRPAGGGSSRRFLLASGDLLVTGGKTQRTWEHSVPKVARAGPRISITFRHGMDRRAYRGKSSSPPAWG